MVQFHIDQFKQYGTDILTANIIDFPNFIHKMGKEIEINIGDDNMPLLVICQFHSITIENDEVVKVTYIGKYQVDIYF